MGFVLYRSSAGSGKTYTLVKEYLKIVLQNPDNFKNILAVTFTNKAAGEMKDRVVQALRNLSTGKDRELAEILRQEMWGQAAPLFSIRERSSRILTHILHHYSDFAIMTIDSFIHKVIRAFALELDLPLNFNIVINYEKLESFVSEKLLSLVGRDEFVTGILLELVFARVLEEKSWSIETDIRRFEKEILNEKNTDWVRGVGALENVDFFRIIENLDTLRLKFVETFNELGSRGLNLIRDVGLSSADFAYKEKGAAGFLQKCAALRVSDIKNFKMNSRFFEGHWTTKSTPAEIRAAVENLLAGGLANISGEIIAHYEHNRGQALTAAFTADHIYLAAIMNRIKTVIDEFKKNNGVIPISEFNVHVYRIIKKSPVPFIYAVIGEKYNHYLVDEFQDTSRLQWENLYPLIENSLGSDFFNMAVGDGKQSIYRWRGGDVEILETDIAARIHPQQLTVKPLDKNYRSCKNIVVFNNRFFEKIGAYYREENRLLEGIYGDPAQIPTRREDGFVSLRFFERPADGADEEDSHEAVLAQINLVIADCRSRGYDFNDIAILVRENKEGRRVAENLLEIGIPVVSPDSLILAKVPLINFFIDILTFLANPADRIAEAAIIYFLALNGKQEHPGIPIAEKKFPAGLDCLLTPEVEEFLRRRNYLVSMPVYEVIEEVIRIFNLQDSLDFFTGGYLQAFLDILSDYTKENSVDFSSFLEWWEFNKNDFTMMVPETKPAVKIMSIHKAKGLEFPVVIIPYANWGHDMDKQLWLIPDPPLPGLPPELALPVSTPGLLEETHFRQAFKDEKEKVLIDNINLLYVAFTRAEDSLYIFALQKRKNDNYELLKELAVPLLAAEIVPGLEYSLGEPPRKVKKGGQEKMPEDIHYSETGTFISQRWYDKVSIRRRAPDFWGFDSYRAERCNWGVLVHQVLSRIRSPEDVPHILETVLISGDMEEAEKKILSEKINDIFAVEMLREWFKPGQQAFIEVPIITDRGILRPDRVIVHENKATVIDFKTGEKHGEHMNQVIKYRNTLLTMGFHEVDAYLFYLDNKEIIQVTAGAGE